MIPPVPEAWGGFAHERFRRFAKAVLSVPKSEITPAKEVLAQLEAERDRVDAKIAAVRRELAEGGHLDRNSSCLILPNRLCRSLGLHPIQLCRCLFDGQWTLLVRVEIANDSPSVRRA